MKLEFERDPSSMACREQLVVIKFMFGGDRQKCGACAKMSRAVFIKVSFGSGRQFHVVALCLCNK